MRERGFYWVQFNRVIPALPEHEPEVAFWNCEEWVLSGCPPLASPRDDELSVLSERLEPPKAQPSHAQAHGALIHGEWRSPFCELCGHEATGSKNEEGYCPDCARLAADIASAGYRPKAGRGPSGV